MTARLSLGLAGLVILASSAWFAASWIDTGSDSTCGSVLRPTNWLGENTAPSCRPVMPVRAAVSAGAAVLAVVLVATAISGRRGRSLVSAAVVLVVSCACAAILLLINERVRSGGGL